MRRVVSLWLPTFPTDRLRRRTANGQPSAWPPERPLVIAEKIKGRRELVAVDAAARAAGLKVGLGLAHAQALQPGLLVAENDHSADNTMLEKLAAWAIRYTPLAAADFPDGLWLDVAGCAHLFGGEERLLGRLTARLAAMGFAATGAIADTPGVAHAVARFAKGGVVPPGHGRAAILDLPIAALRLPHDLVDGLQPLGFTQVRQIVDAPSAPIVRRFGLLPLQRLRQALGEVGEAIQPIDPPPMPRARRGFLEPIATAESLVQVTHDLAGDLCSVLEDAGLGARRIDLLFHRIDGATLAVRIGTARPSRDASHLARLLVERLDSVEPGLGIEAMELAACRVEPLAAQQISALADQQTANLSELIDRLTNRIGKKRVWRSRPHESHTPERAVVRTAPLADPQGAAWPADLPRPVRLIDPPEAVEVLAQVPDYPPSLFCWRGRRYRIVKSDGLERIFNDWWADGPLYALRDYYRVEVDDGSRYWLFRFRDEEQDPAAPLHWFIHGAFA